MSAIGSEPAVVLKPAERGRLASAAADARGLWQPVAILLLAWIGMGLVLELARGTTHLSPLYLRDWDANWYVAAAGHGWPHYVPSVQTTLGFFPGLPILIRTVHALTGLNLWLSADLVQAATEVTMVVAVWLLVRDIWNQRTASRTVALLCFCPAAFILALVYAEPLLLTAAAGCLLALRRRHWLLAGLAAAIATAVRPEGVALVLCCGWEAYRAIRARGEWRSLAAVALAPAGILAWFGYLWSITGTPLAWFDTERLAWNQHLDPLSILREGFHVLNGTVRTDEIISLLGVVVTVGLLILLVRRRSEFPSVLLVFTGVVLVMSALSADLPLRPRFVFTAFPLLIGLALTLPRRAFAAVICSSSLMLAALLVVTLSSRAITP